MCRIDIRDSVDSEINSTQNTENIQQSNNVENNQNSEKLNYNLRKHIKN